MKNNIPIIVLTPVKNESWILEKFLTATSVFADIIIIADQNSTDGSVEIAKKFDKVVLIKISDDEYNEDFRQKLLILKARELVPGKKILIALDADELFAGDSLNSPDWEIVATSSLGTTFTCERIDLLNPVNRCLRAYKFFKFAFIDDGKPHNGTPVNSPRLPFDPDGKIVNLSHIKIIHFARVREEIYFDKRRFYTMMENISGLIPLKSRIGEYSKRVQICTEKWRSEVSHSEWIDVWQNEHGLNLTYFKQVANSQFKIKCIQLFQKYGEHRFYLDDIWDINWNNVIENNIDNSQIHKSFKVKGPVLYHKILTLLLVNLWKLRRANRTIDFISFRLMENLRRIMRPGI